jgi:hypothetical protein
MWDLNTITKQNKSTYKPYCADCGLIHHEGNCKTSFRTATITIGRNITGTDESDSSTPLTYNSRLRQLTRQSWMMFKRSVRNIAEEYGTVTFVKSSGKGEYKGVKEDNYTVVFSIDTANISELKSCLSGFCQYFNQECIALTIGETDLIK